MKNILIVCIQGLTSGILARKLNMTAQEKQEDFSFLSAGFAEAEKHLEWADYVIMTPQVRDRFGSIEEQASLHNAVCLMLADTMVSFQKTEETYGNILRAIGENDGRKKNVPGVLPACLLTACTAAVCGMTAYVLFRLTGAEVFRDLFSMTAGMISLHCSLVLGYSLFEKNGESGLFGLLVSLLILMSLTPFRDIPADPEVYQARCMINTSYWSYRLLPFYLGLEYLFLNLSVCMIYGIDSFRLKKSRISDRNNLTFMLAPMTFLMVCLAFARVLVLSLTA